MTLYALGFDPVQEDVYRALIDDPAISRHGLAVATGQPADAIDNALGALVSREVVVADLRRPCGYVVANPVLAVGEMIDQTADELLRRHRDVVDTHAELLDLAARFRERVDDRCMAGIERVDGMAVTEKLDELSFFTRGSVHLVQPRGHRTQLMPVTKRPLHQRALRRGIEIRMLCDTSLIADPERRAEARRLARSGLQFRVTDDDLEPMIVFDESVVVVPSDPFDTDRGVIVVRQPGLSAGLVRLYRQLWRSASSAAWDESRAAEEPLTSADRRVLELLAAGATDESAARTVGLSTRQVRRRVAGLAQRLDAKSRFQIGVAAARRGWV